MFWQRVVIVSFSLGGMYALRPQPAHASAWGCQVILCMSNPGGPEQYAACVPPMQRLYAVLAHGGSFPTCGEGGTTAALAYEPPYFCPQGSTPAGSQQPGIGTLAGCTYTDPKTEVTYLLAPVQNPYTMNVSIHWQGGSETVYMDPAADRSTLTPPELPPVTITMLATAIQVSNPASREQSRQLMWSPMPRRLFLFDLRSDSLMAIRLRTARERDDALGLADRIIGVPHAKLDHVTNVAALFLGGATLHALYVAQRLGQRIDLEDVACGLSTEPAPAMRLYEAMWNNRHGTPTAAGFIENVPNAAVSDVGELMLNQKLNDILAAHDIIERALARYIR